jgi:hypothetical protein
MRKMGYKWQYGHWAEVAKKNDWSKYFRAVDRGMIGCLGNSKSAYDIRQLVSFDLTSKKGYRDNMKDLNADFVELIRSMRRSGYKFEFYAVPEYSPKNKLPHFHGIFRNENWDGKTVMFIKYDAFSNMWEEIHGAKICFLKSIKSMRENLLGYMVKEVKHAFKEYPYTSKCGYRVHTSKGWLPENTELVHKILKKAANYSLFYAEDDAAKKEIWKKIDKYFHTWAQGKTTGVMRLRENESFFISGQEVIYIKGGIVNIKDFGF